MAMKISHITPVEEWAFKYVIENVTKGMGYDNVSNKQEADVKHVLTPNMFKAFKADSRTVLHLDGNRWFENYMKEVGDEKQ
jgi:hypothetical protein